MLGTHTAQTLPDSALGMRNAPINAPGTQHRMRSLAYCRSLDLAMDV